MSALNSAWRRIDRLNSSARVVVWIMATAVIHSNHKDVNRGTGEPRQHVRRPDLIEGSHQSFRLVLSYFIGYKATSFNLYKGHCI